MLDILRQAADRVGGIPELARRLGVSRQALYRWSEIPASRLVEVSRATGLSIRELREDYAAADLYDQDFFEWTKRQSRLLRAGLFQDLDAMKLAEEIEEMGKRDRRAIGSYVRRILIHLLKWRFQPDRRNESGYASIDDSRDEIARILADSPSLRSEPVTVVPDEYEKARESAASQTGLPLATFPAECPFTVEDVLDRRFLP